jgi:hypothetical protein
MAAVVQGDDIFDQAQLGAKSIDMAWKAKAREWKNLMGRAVKDWVRRYWSDEADVLPGAHPKLPGTPVSMTWLYWVLFQGPSNWPSGLGPEEKALLKLAVASAKYAPLYLQGVKIDRKWDITIDPRDQFSDSQTARAMKKYAAIFKKEVAEPMFKAYRQEAIDKSAIIQRLCAELYKEPCGRQEAADMFFGDMERGWKAKTLDVSPAMYRVFPAYVAWLQLR